MKNNKKPISFGFFGIENYLIKDAKKIIFNKKAMEAFNWINTIVRLVFLIIVMAAVVILIRKYMVLTVDIFGTESNLFAQRLLYSHNSISYLDPDTNRLYPSIIDMEKFEQELSSSLEKTVYYNPEYSQIAAKMTLKNTFGMPLSDKTGRSRIVYYNEEKYKQWIVLARARLSIGPGGAREYLRPLYVLTKDENGNLEPAIIEMSIVIPNA